MKLSALFELENAPVVPAIKSADGEVFKGNKGDMHLDVYMKNKDKISLDDSTSGFVDLKTGKFLTRKETKQKFGFDRSEHSPDFKGKKVTEEEQIIENYILDGQFVKAAKIIENLLEIDNNVSGARVLVNNILSSIPEADFLAPFRKNVTLHHPQGQENLLKIVFKAPSEYARGEIRFPEKQGVPYHEHSRRQTIVKLMSIARKFITEMKRHAHIEDSDITTTSRGVEVFIVSDDFI